MQVIQQVITKLPDHWTFRATLATIRAMLSAWTLRNRKYLVPQSPLREARSLFVAIGRNGETVDSIRELICLDQENRKILTNFAAAYPEEVWVLRALEFRERVLEQFERLVLRSRPHPRTRWKSNC
jgi:hypothetical protein